MNNFLRRAAGLFFLTALAWKSFADGSGLNMVVVVNQTSTNSVQLGNYYCEKRGVPPQNVLRINWPGSKIIWTAAEMDSSLRTPLVAMLASRQLTNQIDFVLLTMDIPYRVTNSVGSVGHNYNGTTSALFYGFKDNPLDTFVYCSLPNNSSNSYAGSEGIFRQTPPTSAASNSWLVLMLTADSLAEAKAVVDRGVVSDGAFPTQTVHLGKSTDVNRNVRYVTFDNAVFNTRLRGNYAMQLTNTGSPYSLGNLLGYQNGRDYFSLAPTNFVPGAMGDNLTSFGGYILEAGHTGIREFLIAGATASHGTVTEPCNYLEKFASPQNYFYQSRGFSVAECYYLSLTNPYQGIIVGEPLCAPFAVPCSGGWSNLPATPLFIGTTNLSAQFTAADVTRPVQRVDLFVDGNFFQTLTNPPPAQGNILYVTLPGASNLSYAVPPAATIGTVASGVAGVLNGVSGTTKVSASVYGDRIELHSTDTTRTGSATFVSTSNHIGSALSLTARVRAERGNFLDSVAYGLRSIIVGTGVATNDVLTLTATKTNSSIVTVSITNFVDGTTLPTFLQNFMNAINGTASLQGADGVVAEDLVQVGTYYWQFNLRARSQGLAAAQFQAGVAGDFDVIPAGVNALDENAADVQPRNHIYITAGRTNVALTIPLNTTTLADGYHELTAVGYEGSHVRTQKRISQNVRVQNTTLSATFTTLVGGTNTALEAALQFSVVANTNTITKIELFSTGGSLVASNGVSNVVFSVGATNLGIGLHPFYAVVTRSDGKQYRTETKWIRIIGAEPPFALAVVNTTPTLAWPATAGRRYEILSSTNFTNAFVLRGAVIPTNSPGLWSETNNSSAQRFYRARTTP